MKITILPILVAVTCMSVSAYPQPVGFGFGPGGAQYAEADLLRISADTRIGSEPASVERIRALISDLGTGSGLYGSCTPSMSKGDHAAVHLVMIGAPAVDSLTKVVQDVQPANLAASELAGKETNQRWFAVQILGRIRDARALPVLDFCIRHEPVPFVRAFAPRALGRFADPRAEAPLLAGLQDAYPDIQASSAVALGSLRSVRAIPALIPLLGEAARLPAHQTGAMLPPEMVSPGPGAAVALGMIGAPSVAALRSALESPNAQTRHFAALGLTLNLAPQANSDARKLIQDTDHEIRLSAVRSEANRKDPDAIPLLATALRDSDRQVAMAAGLALSESGGVTGVKALIDAAESADAMASGAASEALRSVRNPKASELLLSELRNGKGRGRLGAAEALLYERDPRAVDPILSLMADPEPDNRGTAIWLINQLTDKRAFPAVAKAMDDPDGKVRAIATELMSTRNLDPISRPLIRKLLDPSEQVRLYAIYGLSAAGNREAVAPLRALLDHDTPRVRDAALKALDAIQSRMTK